MNWGIKVLQTSALPLGYGAITTILYAYRIREMPKCEKDASRAFLHLSFGAEDEIRTRDIHLGKVTLYP